MGGCGSAVLVDSRLVRIALGEVDQPAVVASAWPRVPENSRQGVSGNFAEVVSWRELATASTRWVNLVFAYDFAAESPEGTGPDIPFGFTGREHDASGLIYSRDRYLDPSTGRWLQPDRIGLQDGPNLYQYAHGAPTRYRDPTGAFADFESLDGDMMYVFLAYLDLFNAASLNVLDSNFRGFLNDCSTSSQPELAKAFWWVVTKSNITVKEIPVRTDDRGGFRFPVAADNSPTSLRTTPGGLSIATSGVIGITPAAGYRYYSINGGPKQPYGYESWGELLAHEFLHLAGLPGENAVDDGFVRRVGRAFRGVGQPIWKDTYYWRDDRGPL